MYTNQVLNLVDAPKWVNSIGYKWVSKKKIGMNGKENTYKMRLVSKATKQIHNVYYNEIFFTNCND